RRSRTGWTYTPQPTCMELSRCYSYLTITTGYANRLSHRLFDGPQLIQPTMVRVQKAVVLLSGGMDSATALAMTQKEGFDVIALTLDYGQRHRREIAAAKRVAAHFRVREHRVVSLDLTAIGGSALTDQRIPIPEGRPMQEIGRGIPVTYVPARNTIFLSYALGLAEAAGAAAIVIAANFLDYSGYVDCRPEFYRAFQEVARLGTKRGVEGHPIEIRTPLIEMSKADIVRAGESLGVPWALTWSCYHGRAKACGVCDSCQLRLKGFREAGIEDPLLQAESIAAAVRRLPEDFVHSFETDGEVDLHTFDRLAPAERASGRVRYVMDVKCPGSGMKAEKAYANLGLLQPHDEVKFV